MEQKHVKTRGVSATLDWLLYEIGTGPTAKIDTINTQNDSQKIYPKHLFAMKKNLR